MAFLHGHAATRVVAMATASLVVLSLTGVQAGPLEDAAPLSPWGLTATTASEGVWLSWNAPAGPVDEYTVYRAPGMEAVILGGWDAFSPIGTTQGTQFLDPDPGPGGAIYAVTTMYEGNESPPSNPAGYPSCLTIDPGCYWPPPL